MIEKEIERLDSPFFNHIDLWYEDGDEPEAFFIIEKGDLSGIY